MDYLFNTFLRDDEKYEILHNEDRLTWSISFSHMYAERGEKIQSHRFLPAHNFTATNFYKFFKKSKICIVVQVEKC